MGRGSGGSGSIARLKRSGRSAPIHYARGEALERAWYLLAAESISTLAAIAPELATTARQIIGLPENPDDEVARWIEAARQLGQFDFGESAYRVLDEAAAREIDEHVRRYASKSGLP